MLRALCRTTQQGKCCCLQRAFRKPPCAWARPQSRQEPMSARTRNNSECLEHPGAPCKNTTVVDLVARMCETAKGVLSNCAKVGKNSVSRLSPPCIFSKNCAFSPGTQDRRNALQLLHLPSVEFVRDIRSFNRVWRRLGCKIERRQMLHTEARPGWHTCASDPLLVLEPQNELQLSERWNRSDPALDMPCELHEQKPESNY